MEMIVPETGVLDGLGVVNDADVGVGNVTGTETGVTDGADVITVGDGPGVLGVLGDVEVVTAGSGDVATGVAEGDTASVTIGIASEDVTGATISDGWAEALIWPFPSSVGLGVACNESSGDREAEVVCEAIGGVTIVACGDILGSGSSPDGSEPSENSASPSGTATVGLVSGEKNRGTSADICAGNVTVGVGVFVGPVAVACDGEVIVGVGALLGSNVPVSPGV